MNPGKSGTTTSCSLAHLPVVRREYVDFVDSRVEHVGHEQVDEPVGPRIGVGRIDMLSTVVRDTWRPRERASKGVRKRRAKG